MSFEFSVITGKQVNAVLKDKTTEIVKMVEKAYLLHEEGKTVNPNSYFLRFREKPKARIIALPAYLGGEFNISGLKWIGSNPDNVKNGFPRASAVLILNDYETGYPFACLESSIISAVRTAASAVLAATYIGKQEKRAKCLGIVGTGIIAKYIYKILVATGWQIDEVALYDTQIASSKRFTAYIDQDKHKKINLCESLEELVSISDLIVLTTSALDPYINDTSLLKHNPTILNISLRDLSPEVLLASNNIVDDVEHVLQANTSPHLTEQQVGYRDFINGTIASLIKENYLLADDRPTVFSPMGMGILDLAVGKYVYDQVIQSQQAIKIPEFFYELER